MLESLKIALCGETVDTMQTQDPVLEEKTITMSGPLSEVFTQALQIVFAKKDMVTEETQVETAGIESQANDAIMAMSILANQKGFGRNIRGSQSGGNIIRTQLSSNFGVYAIPVSIVKADTIPSAASAMIGGSNIGQLNYLVLDNTATVSGDQDSAPVTDYPVISSTNQYTALESQCAQFGIHLVVGFENLVKILKHKG